MGKKIVRPGPLTAREFFAAEIVGGTVSDASRECKLPWMTVSRIARGVIKQPRVKILKALEAWSRQLSAAKALGVWIDPSKTLGLAS